MSRHRTIGILVAAGVLSVSGLAQAKKHKHYKYVGGHPLDKHEYCYIEAPHVHVFAPAHGNKKRIKLEYRVYDDHYYFVGDPVARGYDGEPYGYYGHHPIAADVVAGMDVEPHVVTYCYLNGPHFHAYAPPPDIEFEVKGGVRWYVGAYPPEYERDKRVMVQINPLYAEVHYDRPVVEVDPPEAYIGPIVEVHAPVVAVEAPVAEAEVHGGVEVDVHIPTPTLEVEVGLPGIMVIDDDHHHHRSHKKFKGHGKYKRRHGKKRKHGIKNVWRR